MNEIESCSTLVSSMRVPQLQAIVHTFDPTRSSGRKQELQQRIYNLLRDKKTQSNTCQRIREITRTPALNAHHVLRPQFNQFPRMVQPAPFFQQHRPTQQPYMNAFMPQQISNMNVPVVMPSKIGGRAEKMQITRLPFYDNIDVVVKMSELQALNGRSGECRCSYSFTIKPEHLNFITYRGDQPTPRYELQLRMFHYDADIEQADDFPPNCTIKIDDNPVTLPNVIPTNKPNAEPKRYSRPVDITQYVQSRNCVPRPHRIDVDWFSDRRNWAFGIWLVHRQNADILLQRMLTNGVRRAVNDTKKRIASMLDGDDDNIALSQLKISLLCPLMKTRMKIPARTATCSHLQCFDLLNYLNMNEKRPSWKCPQCNTNAHFDNLIIDQYFMDLLDKVEHNVEEVELLRDGNWKILEVACDTLSDDDDDDISPAKVVKVEEVKSNKTPNKKNDDAEIITLDDSDDEGSVINKRNVPVASVSTSSENAETPPPSRTPLTTNGSNIASSKPSSSSGPAAKQSKTDKSSYRRSKSSSSSSGDTSDSDEPRRRKVPTPSRSNGSSNAASSSKKSNDAEVITLDSSSDDEDVAPAGRINQTSSRSTNGSNRNGTNGSTDSNPPQLSNGVSTNGTHSKRPNGVHSSVTEKSTQKPSLDYRLNEVIEHEVADGLTHFVNSIFLRDSRNTFNPS